MLGNYFESEIKIGYSRLSRITNQSEMTCSLKEPTQGKSNSSIRSGFELHWSLYVFDSLKENRI